MKIHLLYQIRNKYYSEMKVPTCRCEWKYENNLFNFERTFESSWNFTIIKETHLKLAYRNLHVLVKYFVLTGNRGKIWYFIFVNELFSDNIKSSTF